VVDEGNWMVRREIGASFLDNFLVVSIGVVNEKRKIVTEDDCNREFVAGHSLSATAARVCDWL